MKTKNIILIAFVIVAVIQLFIPAKMIYSYENILSKGKQYKFQIAPIDPSDPFRGKYININIKESRIKVDTFCSWDRNENIYVLLDSDSSSGFVTVRSITKDKPQPGMDFIKAKVAYANYNIVSIDYPFEEYYLEESAAPKAEERYYAALRDTSKTSYITVNAIDGNAIINDLIICGKSIREMR